MEKYCEESIFKVSTTETKLIIEVNIDDLAFLLQASPNNSEPPIIAKSGRYKEFADFIVTYLTETENQDTGDSPIMEMFENALMEIMEGYEDFCIYPDEE